MQTVTIEEEKGREGERRPGSFEADVLAGLSTDKKSISSKYLYDEEGSGIFQEITRLREYYLTRSEENILNSYRSSIASEVESKLVSVTELGVGDGHKTKIILDELLGQDKTVKFFPVDISSEAFHQLEANIDAGEKLEVCGVVGEYLPGLAYARSRSNCQMLVLFLGSNIGNFFPEARGKFLRNIRANLNLGDLILVGFDLKKEIDILMSAYNDVAGVTAKFNLNLLKRINRELGGAFEVRKFRHHAYYNPVLGAMESYLISLEEQSVYVSAFDREFHFDSFEPIHLEYSFKFSRKEVEQIAHAAGFKAIRHFYDKRGYYLDSLWEAVAEKQRFH